MALSTLQPFSLQTWEWYGLSYLLVKQEVNKHITRYVWPSLKTWWIMLHYFLQFERVLIPGVNDRCVFCPLESVSERHVVTLWNSRRSARLFQSSTSLHIPLGFLLDFCAPFSVIATTFPQRRWNSPSYRQRQACWNFIAGAQFGYVYTTN